MNTFEIVTAAAGASFVMAFWDAECWKVWMGAGCLFLASQWLLLIF